MVELDLAQQSGAITWVLAVADILLVAYVVYRVLLLIRGTRAQQVLTGLGLIAAGYFASRLFGLKTVSWLLDNFISSFLLIGYIMITGVAAHGMMIVALLMAPASVLQPFNYTSLPWALLISALIFHEPLDAISLIGAAVIVGAGLVVMARERIKKVPTVGEPALPGKE